MDEVDKLNHLTLTLDEVCINCGLSVVEVTTYVEEGLIEFGNEDPQEWRFSPSQAIYFKKASRLERDLRLNPAGAVLVLELITEIETLKKQLRRYSE